MNPKVLYVNKTISFFVLFFLSFGIITSLANASPTKQCKGILGHKIKKLRSTEVIDLCDAFKGKVILAVNTASQCGFTPQFAELEKLYQAYKDKGLVVLGFPSNDFYQEHKDEEKTASVCYKNYGVTFPMFSTSSVKGDKANPVFLEMNKQSGKKPKWNFFKYLVDKNENVVELYSSKVSPDDKVLMKKIEALIAEK